MGSKYLEDWDAFEKFQKTGDKGASHADVAFFDGYGKGGKQASYRPSCHLKHPPLAIPGTGKVIYGGTCIGPHIKDADVYIGFDMGMTFTERSYPWRKGTEFLFRIPDMGAPDSPEEFKKLVSWTRQKLEAGLKVHCGCVGGHGRTGTFLAALCAEAGEKDAITYVREHYCKKAVESAKQVDFLVKHFGVKKVAGFKEFEGAKGGKKGGSGVEVVHSPISKFTPMPQPFTLVKPSN